MSAFHFIVNPLAGSGRSAELFAVVEEKLKALGISYESTFTTAAHQGAELTREAIAAGAECVVAVGGDGTINEVAEGLFGHEGVKFGVMPFGSGNDFARCTGIPAEAEGALDVILGGFTRKLDIGRANDRFFVNVAGIGFDVDVLRATEKYKVKYNGMFPYLMGIFDALFHLRAMHMTIDVNGETIKQDALLVAIGNGQYFGGGMQALPHADPFDGLFDIRIVKKVSIPRFLMLLPRFVKGSLKDDCPLLLNLRSDKLRVSCAEECALDLDGELLSQTPAEFSLVPGALELFVKKEKDEPS